MATGCIISHWDWPLKGWASSERSFQVFQSVFLSVAEIINDGDLKKTPEDGERLPTTDLKLNGSRIAVRG